MLKTLDQNAEFVLVEDDALVRFLWQSIARNRGFRLRVYESGSEFLKDLDLYTRETRFFLDYDLGPDKGAGVELARAIKARLGAYTHLVTNHSPCNFKQVLEEGVLDDVSGKFPHPFSDPLVHF